MRSVFFWRNAQSFRRAWAALIRRMEAAMEAPQELVAALAARGEALAAELLKQASRARHASERAERGE